MRSMTAPSTQCLFELPHLQYVEVMRYYDRHDLPLLCDCPKCRDRVKRIQDREREAQNNPTKRRIDPC